VALAVGRASLEARQLGALAPGDVLVPDELTYWPGRSTLGEARLTTSGWTARVLWTDDGWQVRSIERTAERERGRIEAEGGAMSEARDDEQASVAEVPVEIAIELGRIELRVRELAALVPGRIVSARVPVGGAVSLRAGDRTIATGELVDLEGELGVRILALHR
jgi:type III secretion system YscQ/HrcQ family protein